LVMVVAIVKWKGCWMWGRGGKSWRVLCGEVVTALLLEL
jgi:hypothetical protein